MKKMESDGKGGHLGEALVQFTDAKCARRAHAYLNGKTVAGTLYQVCFEGQAPDYNTPAAAAAEGPRTAFEGRHSPVQTLPTNQIEISNLRPDVSTNQLRKFTSNMPLLVIDGCSLNRLLVIPGQRFIRYGTITSTALSRASSGQTAARLTFEDVKGAEKALDAMHKAEYCSRTIQVVYVGSTTKVARAAPPHPASLSSAAAAAKKSRTDGGAASEIDGEEMDMSRFGADDGNDAAAASAPSSGAAAAADGAVGDGSLDSSVDSSGEVEKDEAAADRTPTETASGASPSRSEEAERSKEDLELSTTVEEQRESTLSTWEKSQKEQERSGRDERASPSVPLCHFFSSPGGCARGDACWFRHEDPSAVATLPADAAADETATEEEGLAAADEGSDELSAEIEEGPVVESTVLSIVSADGTSLDSAERLQAWRKELTARIRGPGDAHLKFIEVDGTELTLATPFTFSAAVVLEMRLTCRSAAALEHAKGLLANLIGTIGVDLMRDDGLRVSSAPAEAEGPADDTAFVIDTVGAPDGSASGDGSAAVSTADAALLKGWTRLQRLKTLGAELVAAAAAAGEGRA